jgi:hypothetical protein
VFQAFNNQSEYLWSIARDTKLSCLPFDAVSRSVGHKAADFLHGTQPTFSLGS